MRASIERHRWQWQRQPGNLLLPLCICLLVVILCYLLVCSTLLGIGVLVLVVAAVLPTLAPHCLFVCHMWAAACLFRVVPLLSQIPSQILVVCTNLTLSPLPPTTTFFFLFARILGTKNNLPIGIHTHTKTLIHSPTKTLSNKTTPLTTTTATTRCATHTTGTMYSR